MNLNINQSSAKLIRQLKAKDKLAAKLNRNCDILTALLQARSEKRSKYCKYFLQKIISYYLLIRYQLRFNLNFCITFEIIDKTAAQINIIPSEFI